MIPALLDRSENVWKNACLMRGSSGMTESRKTETYELKTAQAVHLFYE